MCSAVLGTFAVYLTAAALLVYRYNSINGDALSRVENGALMVFSRDPHMAAVGFVWNPLPSFMATPFLFLKPWFPSLLSRGFAGSIVAAMCGAAAAGVLLAILRDLGVRPLLRWVLLLSFAGHPLVLYAGSNGMSEAPYLLMLMLSCRYLLRWLRTESVADLVACGVALAVGYSTRYEVIVAGAGAAGLVAMVRFSKIHGGWRIKVREALVDVGIVVAPVAFVFVGWAIVSWVIVGSPFEQFTSEYGNASQLSVLGNTLGAPRSGGPALGYALRQLLLISAALPLALVLPLLVALRRRAVAVLAPWAIFGSILAFEVLAYYRGQTASWLRYYVIAVPFVVLVSATMLATPAGRTRDRTSGSRLVLAATALGLAGTGVLTSSTMFRNHDLAREEATQLEAVVDHRGAASGSRLALQRLGVERQVVRYVDQLHLADGSILIDTAMGFEIVTQSRHPKTFVVTSDRDFQESVADPVAFRIPYIIVPPAGGLGALDALNRSYPSLYKDGAGIATLVKEFENIEGRPNWRLYKVNEAAP